MKLFLIIFALFTLCGCTKNETADIFAMDTIITLDVYGKNSKETISQMKTEITRLDKKYAPSDNYTKDKETEYVIKTAEKISALTEGAFDINLSEVMKLWGFRSQSFRVPSDEEIKKALSTKALDFGGIAKGYAGDRLKKIAENNGINSAILSLGGNVTAIGKKADGTPWKIGIADPENTAEYIGYVEVSDKSVVTSGAYQRNFEENGKIYHHILNPKTGYPADSGIISATVIADEGIIADSLSTAFFVLGTEKTMELYRKNVLDFEAVLVEADGDIITTDNTNFFRKE